MRWINLRQVVWLFALLLLFSQNIALAGLQPTFSIPLDANQIDLFWAGDANLPSDGTGRAVSGDPGSALNETNPSKPGATPPSSLYFFWSGPTPVASQTNYIRIWNTNNRSRADGSLYTALWGESGNNGYMSMAPVPGGITVTYSYIKANAGTGRILGYDEANTSVIGPPPATSRRVVFSAEQPTSSGYNVQIKEVQWRVITPDRGTLTLGGDGGSPLTLTLRDDTYRMNPGDVYRVYFKYKSYWGDWGTESPELIYTVGAGPTGGAGGGVYNLAIKLQGNPTDTYATPIELSWASTPGITAFKIWVSSTGLPGSFSELAGGPYTSPAVFTSIADQAQVYFTVTPDTVTTLNDQPRQVVGKYTYKLLKPAGRTGINSIALPFTRTWSQPTGADVADTELTNAASLNTTMANFEFAGGWDPERQIDVGYLSTGGGSNFGLLSGVGYQVSVSANNTFYTVVGIK